jgi:hypothetical protein
MNNLDLNPFCLQHDSDSPQWFCQLRPGKLSPVGFTGLHPINAERAEVIASLAPGRTGPEPRLLKPAPISTIRTISTVLRVEIENMLFDLEQGAIQIEKPQN